MYHGYSRSKTLHSLYLHNYILTEVYCLMGKNTQIIFNNMEDNKVSDDFNIITFLQDQAIKSCKNNNCDYCIIIGQNKSNTYVFLYSATYMTRAGDLFRYLAMKLSQFGKGNLEEGTDTKKVSSWCFALFNEMSGVEMNEQLRTHIEEIITKYINVAVVIDGKTYYQTHSNEIEKFPMYQKKSICRCYVKVNDLKKYYGLGDDDEILLRTLENKSGVLLKAGSNDIIMIGSNGEPYNMQIDKFQKLYQDASDGTLINEVTCAYDILPDAVICGSEKVINLLDHASLCASKKINIVHAKKVKNGIYKVFSARIACTNEYYYGIADEKPFYLTVDKDTPTSVHIVDATSFAKSYEPVIALNI